MNGLFEAFFRVGKELSRRLAPKFVFSLVKHIFKNVIKLVVLICKC